jgi:CO/xanthine dehydrogenase Mo-binding subunit
LSQIAAEELDIAVEHVTMHGTNTNTSPFDRSTAASRSTSVMGNAIRSAAGELRQQIIDAAAEVLHAEQKNINLKTGEVICGDKRVSTARFEYFGMPVAVVVVTPWWIGQFGTPEYAPMNRPIG